MPAPRPRRSVLYMPGSNARALEKARGLPADGLIFDLEDAVAPDAKAQARATVAAAVAQGGYGKREIFLRVNGLSTPWGHADLCEAAHLAIDAVLLPKVESVDAIRQAGAVLAEHNAPATLAIWCMIETPRGVLKAAEIADVLGGAFGSGLGGLVMGTSDLVKDLHVQASSDRLPLVTALQLPVLAARAARLPILDGVHLDLADDDGFAASCRQGRAFGFDGKTLIHPKQIAAANAAFAPSAEEVAWARRIIAAHAEAAASGKGIVLVDGKLIENLHVEEAGRVVALADAIAAQGTSTQ